MPDDLHRLTALVQAGQLDEARALQRRLLPLARAGLKVAAIEASLAGEVKSGMKDIKGPALGLQPIVWVGIILAVPTVSILTAVVQECYRGVKSNEYYLKNT